MRNLKYLVSLLPLLLVACISYQVQDTQDAIVTAKYTLVGINNTITDLVTNKQITKDQAQKLASTADQARSSLDTASVLMSQGKPQDALGALRIANTILIQLQQQLEKQK